MSLDDVRQLFRWLRRATEEQVRWIIAHLTPADFVRLDSWFEFWAHEAQLPPKGEGWRVWLMMAGRGFGKTRAGAEWVFRLGCARPGVRIALVGANIQDARNIMVEGVSGLLKVGSLHGYRLQWEPSLGRLKWPNGSEAQLFSGDHANGLRGPEHDFAWCAADARHPGCACGGTTSANLASSFAFAGSLLSGCSFSHRRLGRQATMCCRLHEWRLALHHSRGGNDCVRSHIERLGGVPRGLLGDRFGSGLKPHPRRRASGRQPRGSHCFAGGRNDCRHAGAIGD